MTTEQIKKLPLWAQKMWVDGEREVARLTESARMALDTQTKTNVHYDGYPVSEIKYVQSDRVAFQLGEKRIIEVTLDGTRLIIRATGTFSDRLIISPTSGNSAEVWASRV